MRYRTFTGKTKQEAYAALNEEKRLDPDLKDARLIKDSHSTVSTFMGLKQSTVYEIVVGIPEHTNTFENKKKLPILKHQSFISKKDSSDQLSSIEKSVLKKEKQKISANAQDTLFAIQSATKVAEQISQLEDNLKKKTPQLLPKTTKFNLSMPTNNKEQDLKKELSSIKNEFKELKQLLTAQHKLSNTNQIIDTLQEQRELPNEYEIYQQHIRWIDKYLNTKEFSQELINDIIEHLEKTPEILTDKKQILQVVEEFLISNVPTTTISLDNYQYSNNIIFVGSTGVGKTSTIVKLAAHLSLMRKKSFRFISIDRYKVGGETQLEKLASYMNTQFHAINKQEEFFDLLKEKTSDYTFIDTAGKGPKDNIAIQELSHWIAVSGVPMDIHLVVSATTKVSDLDNVCQAYSLLNFNHILVTKLDETSTFGSIVSLAYKYKKPLSFVTDGQEIPQDFEIANPTSLIKKSLQ